MRRGHHEQARHEHLRPNRIGRPISPSDKAPWGEHQRRAGAELSPVAHVVSELQRGVGNRAVQRLVGVSTGMNGTTEDDVARRIDAGAGGGQPLERTSRRRLEEALGTDLAGVRVHTGPEADGLARSLRARAFTSGQDIWFRSGAYDPSSTEGLRTLAHEVAHTVQQAAGPVDGCPTPGGSLAVSDPGDRFEQAAHAAAEAVVAGVGTDRHIGAGQTSSGPALARPVQREEEKKDYLNYQFQMDPELQKKFYGQTPEELKWLGYDPMSSIPTGGQYDLQYGGVTSKGHASLAGAAGEVRYRKRVIGKDGKPEYVEVAAGQGSYDLTTKEGKAKFNAEMDLDPVKIKGLVDLSTKGGAKASADAKLQLEKLMLNATLAAGPDGFDTRILGEYGFDKNTISAMAGIGSAGFSAEARGDFNFDETKIKAMMGAGPAGMTGSLEGSTKIGAQQISAYLRAHPGTAEAGIGANLQFPGQYGLAGQVGTSGYNATATLPLPFTVGGLQPYAAPSISGAYGGTPTVGLTGGVMVPLPE